MAAGGGSLVTVLPELENAVGDDSSLSQKVTVKPNTRYLLSGYVKCREAVPMEAKAKIGVCLAVRGGYEHSPALLGSSSWIRPRSG